MKTDELIHLLATQSGPVRGHWAWRTFFPAGFAMWAFAAVCAWLVLGWVPAALFAMAGMQVKLLYVWVLVVASGLLLSRLGRPGVEARAAGVLVLLVPATMMLYGGLGYLWTPEDLRRTALLGHSYLVCPWAILALSVPGLFVAFWAMRNMAPTRIRLTGAVCGLFAGSLGAAGYALACSEVAVPFVSLWYTLGIALVAALGAALGPRFLNW